jgi:hypothetical protein
MHGWLRLKGTRSGGATTSAELGTMRLWCVQSEQALVGSAQLCRRPPSYPVLLHCVQTAQELTRTSSVQPSSGHQCSFFISHHQYVFTRAYACATVRRQRRTSVEAEAKMRSRDAWKLIREGWPGCLSEVPAGELCLQNVVLCPASYVLATGHCLGSPSPTFPHVVVACCQFHCCFFKSRSWVTDWSSHILKATNIYYAQPKPRYGLHFWVTLVGDSLIVFSALGMWKMTWCTCSLSALSLSGAGG